MRRHTLERRHRGVCKCISSHLPRDFSTCNETESRRSHLFIQAGGRQPRCWRAPKVPGQRDDGASACVCVHVCMCGCWYVALLRCCLSEFARVRARSQHACAPLSVRIANRSPACVCCVHACRAVGFFFGAARGGGCTLHVFGANMFVPRAY